MYFYTVFLSCWILVIIILTCYIFLCCTPNFSIKRNYKVRSLAIFKTGLSSQNVTSRDMTVILHSFLLVIKSNLSFMDISFLTLPWSCFFFFFVIFIFNLFYHNISIFPYKVKIEYGIHQQRVWYLGIQN